jgi:Holliday junction resolvase RusA-like endonuclease
MGFKRFAFFVPGVPASAGSKRAFVNRSTGRVSVVDSCAENYPWRSKVAIFGEKTLRAINPEVPLIDEPIELDVVFYFTRPKGHFGEKAGVPRLKGSAPNWPTKPPDSTKLLRSIEDALNGVVWRDDSLVVVQRARKVYADRPGAVVTIAPALFPSDYDTPRMVRP